MRVKPSTGTLLPESKHQALRAAWLCRGTSAISSYSHPLTLLHPRRPPCWSSSTPGRQPLTSGLCRRWPLCQKHSPSDSPWLISPTPSSPCLRITFSTRPPRATASTHLLYPNPSLMPSLHLHCTQPLLLIFRTGWFPGLLVSHMTPQHAPRFYC